MKHTFIENSLIIIPFVYKEYRLQEGEKVRIRCNFKTEKGDYPYVLCMCEDNKGVEGPDGHYSFTLDTATYGILPGRYRYSIELILASGRAVTLKNARESEINIVPAINEEECGCVE